MIVRIVLFIAGLALAGGGGWLAWTNHAASGELFSPGAPLTLWLLVAGVAGACAGLVLLVSAVVFTGASRAKQAEAAERTAKALSQADAFYAERARAADRDWRSDTPVPPQPTPAAKPAGGVTAGGVVGGRAPFPSSATLTSRPGTSTTTPPPRPPEPAAAAPAAPPVQPSAQAPVPQATVQPVVAQPVPVPPAPAQAAPAQPAPAPAEPTPGAPQDQEPSPVAAPAASSDAPEASEFEAIRAALREQRLDEAESLLTVELQKLKADPATPPVLIAELTTLAGDHAQAAGREGQAAFLWKQAMRRYRDAGASELPAARALAAKVDSLGATPPENSKLH